MNIALKWMELPCNRAPSHCPPKGAAKPSHSILSPQAQVGNPPNVLSIEGAVWMYVCIRKSENTIHIHAYVHIIYMYIHIYIYIYGYLMKHVSRHHIMMKNTPKVYRSNFSTISRRVQGAVKSSIAAEKDEALISTRLLLFLHWKIWQFMGLQWISDD